MSQSNFKEAHWDNEKSTFRHNFYYSCGRIVSGYSKKKGFDESPEDKLRLLAGILVRLNDYKYFDSPKKIAGKFMAADIFRRHDEKGWVKFVTIYPGYYEFNDEFFDPDFKIMLNQFTIYRTNLDAVSFRTRYSNVSSAPVSNLAMKNRFSSKNQLQEHCKRLVNQSKEELGPIQNFYRDQCNNFFGGFKSLDKLFVEDLLKYRSS
jgi:hypothetical protein